MAAAHWEASCRGAVAQGTRPRRTQRHGRAPPLQPVGLGPLWSLCALVHLQRCAMRWKRVPPSSWQPPAAAWGRQGFSRASSRSVRGCRMHGAARISRSRPERHVVPTPRPPCRDSCLCCARQGSQTGPAAACCTDQTPNWRVRPTSRALKPSALHSAPQGAGIGSAGSQAAATPRKHLSERCSARQPLTQPLAPWLERPRPRTPLQLRAAARQAPPRLAARQIRRPAPPSRRALPPLPPPPSRWSRPHSASRLASQAARISPATRLHLLHPHPTRRRRRGGRGERRGSASRRRSGGGTSSAAWPTSPRMSSSWLVRWAHGGCSRARAWAGRRVCAGRLAGRGELAGALRCVALRIAAPHACSHAALPPPRHASHAATAGGACAVGGGGAAAGAARAARGRARGAGGGAAQAPG